MMDYRSTCRVSLLGHKSAIISFQKGIFSVRSTESLVFAELARTHPIAVDGNHSEVIMEEVGDVSTSMENTKKASLS